MKKLFTLFFFLISTSFFIKAQGYNYQWHKTIGGATTSDIINCITNDNSGNIYIGGIIRSESTGGLPIPYSNLGANTTDGFIAKLSSAGIPIWIKTLPAATAGGQIQLDDLVVNNAGQVFFCGMVHGGNMDIDPGVAQNIVTAPVGKIGIIGALTQNGDFSWGGSISSITDIAKILITPDGDIAFGGTFYNNAGNIDVNISPSVSNMPVSNSGLRNGPFILEYTSAGVYIKYIMESLPGDLSIPGYTVDAFFSDMVIDNNGDFYISGNKTPYFGNVVQNAKSFIQKVPKNFVTVWPAVPKFPKTIQFGYNVNDVNSADIQFNALTIDANNNLYVGGALRATSFNPVDFDPDAGVSSQYSAAQSWSGFIIKYNDTLAFSQFAKLFTATPGVPLTNAIVYDMTLQNNSLQICGSFTQTVDLDPTAGVQTITSNGAYDNFIATYDNNINLTSAHSFGGASNVLPSPERALRLLKSASAVYVLTLMDNDISDIDPSVSTQSVPLIGGQDGLLIKFGLNAPLPVLYKNFTAQLQKDNMVNLSWVTSSEYNSSHFEAERSTDGKLWHKIGMVSAQGNSETETHYKIIDKEIFAGSMYYRIRQVDLDGQYTYTNVEKVSRTTTNEISIYPNPCTMTLNILMNENSQTSTIEIYSMDGRKIISEQSNELTHKVNINSLTKGTYMLRVYNNEKAFTTKFVRQ